MKNSKTIFVTDNRVHYTLGKLRNKSLSRFDQQDYDLLLGEWKIFMRGPARLLGLELTPVIYASLLRLELLVQKEPPDHMRLGTEAPRLGMQQPMQDNKAARRKPGFWSDKLQEIYALYKADTTAPDLARQYETSIGQIYACVNLARRQLGEPHRGRHQRRRQIAK